METLIGQYQLYMIMKYMYLNLIFVCLFVCLFGFYGILTFVGYLIPNPFLWKWTVLFQTIQFCISTQFNCQKQLYFKLFSWVNSSIWNNSV